jgi:hypothetical protein
MAPAYREQMGAFTGRGRGGHNYLHDFKQTLDQTADGQTQMAQTIYETKWQILAELIRLAAELILLTLMSDLGLGSVAEVEAGALARSRIAILTAMFELLQRARLMPAVTEAFEEAFMNFIVRLGILLAGPREIRPHTFDWRSIGTDGLFGLLMGLGMGHLPVVRNQLSRLLKHGHRKDRPAGAAAHPAQHHPGPAHQAQHLRPPPGRRVLGRGRAGDPA